MGNACVELVQANKTLMGLVRGFQLFRFMPRDPALTTSPYSSPRQVSIT